MNANPAVSAVASIIERIASTVVALDEATQQRLRDLDGRILVFELSAPSANLRLRFTDGSVRVAADTGYASEPSHTIVRGPSIELLQGLVTGKLSGSVTIDGDEALLSTLQDCLQQLRPDFSAVLEPIAQQPGLSDLVGQAEYAVASLQAVAGNLLSNLRTAGRRHFADEDDLALFAERLESLKLKVDRLNARTDLLRTSRDNSGL